MILLFTIVYLLVGVIIGYIYISNRYNLSNQTPLPISLGLIKGYMMISLMWPVLLMVELG